MANDLESKPSFSPGHKWRIGLDMAIRTVVVLAVVIMANYLGGRHFGRWFLSPATRNELSPRTVSLLKSFTNQVKVTLYFDKEDRFYPTIQGLLNEFHNVNPRITVIAVDPIRDLSEAVKLKQEYNLGTATNRNFVIFDCEGGGKQFLPGDLLVTTELKRITSERELTFERKATAFNGEVAFVATLLKVTSPKPFKAYFLKDYGTHAITDGDAQIGYLKFAQILQQNYIQPVPLSLLGTNTVPQDCNLLVIAGPTQEIYTTELEKIAQYLDQGGRLLVLFSPLARNPQPGLKRVLERWGVRVGEKEIRDVENSERGDGLDAKVGDFGPTPHPVVSALVNLRLHLILPHPVGALRSNDRGADGPNVQEIAFSGEHAVLAKEPRARPQRFPLAVAVERGDVKGVITERGTTRLVVVGDSIFLGNEMIESAGNREFASSAVNWLLDRQQLLEGVGPRPLKDYRISITHSELVRVRWMLLAALPGAIVLLGALVWFRRRK